MSWCQKNSPAKKITPSNAIKIHRSRKGKKLKKVLPSSRSMIKKIAATTYNPSLLNSLKSPSGRIRFLNNSLLRHMIASLTVIVLIFYKNLFAFSLRIRSRDHRIVFLGISSDNITNKAKKLH